MRTPIAAGNWKLNKTTVETKEYFQELNKLISNVKCDIVIAPVSLSIQAAVGVAGQAKIASQNCYSKDGGAFTGELSAPLIKAAGATHVILGHSERRSIFKETDNDINNKIKHVQEHGLVPIFCIGETLEEREAGKVEEILERQLTYGLQGIEIDASTFVVAYEPVWAIGTGKTASPEDAQNAHAFVRKVLKNLYNEDTANQVRILYGGSVKPDNIKELIGQKDIDGGLVGGASLKPTDFSKIIEGISNSI